MANPKLTVTTPVGTFTRRTARTYSHLVVAGPARFEALEASRINELAHTQKELARYQADSLDVDGARRRGGWGDWFTLDWLKRTIHEMETRISHLEANGPITADRGTWGVLSWNGRLDLSRAEATRDTARRFREVRIYEVATGNLVATFTH